MRIRWVAVSLIAAAGCFGMPPPVPTDPSPNPLPHGERGLSAPLSLSGKGAGGLGAAEPDDPLTLAAECLGRGDQLAASTHLAAYVRAHPDQIMFRAHLAELLLKLDRDAEAKAQFERFVADAQDATGPPKGHLVHCHTRLMELGQRADDRFAELFHRGVGLLLLVNDADGDTREEILCQALKALTEAKELHPTDPRVHFYLADAHDRAGNRRGADVARAAARNLSAPGVLTPSESRRLAVAGATD